jgi:hypothetical protein
MSLIKKLLDNTLLSTDICNIISLKIYKSNYNNCIEEYLIKLYGENKVYWNRFILIKINNRTCALSGFCIPKPNFDIDYNGFYSSKIRFIDFIRHLINNTIFNIKFPNIPKSIFEEFRKIESLSISSCSLELDYTFVSNQ